MQQTNRESARGWQTWAAGSTIYNAETITIASADAGMSRQGAAIAFQPYLQSIVSEEKYRQQWGFYTATDAVGQLQERKRWLGWIWG